MKPRRASRGAAILVFAALVVALMYIDFVTPSASSTPLLDLGLTVAGLGLHAMLVAAVYVRLEAKLSSRALLVAATAVAALLAAALSLAVWWLAPQLFAPEPPSWTAVAVSGAVTGTISLGIYVLIVRHPKAIDEARTLRLEGELASLRGRLEPHFLLNSLNAIAAIVAEDPARARRAIAALGELLTEALERTTDRSHTLDRELVWLRAYATIFETRYGDTLAIEWDVAPGLGAFPLPRLLVQPLVENAFVHGIAAASAGKVAITVRAGATGGLVVEIANTGPSVAAADIIEGHGLALVRRRLALEVPGARLALFPGPTGGMLATLELPAPGAGS